MCSSPCCFEIWNTTSPRLPEHQVTGWWSKNTTCTYQWSKCILFEWSQGNHLLYTFKIQYPNGGECFLCERHDFCEKSIMPTDIGRVATAQGKQGIWLSLFPDRENREFRYNMGKIWTTQGIFKISLKINYFIVNCPFINWCTPIVF